MAAQRSSDESDAVARYRSSLAALLSEIERPESSEAALAARGERCATAFEALTRDPQLSEPERRRLLSLVGATLAAAQQQRDDLARRMKLTCDVLRTTRSARLDGSVGDWCDIAG